MTQELTKPKGQHGGPRGNAETSSTAPNFIRLVWTDLLRNVYHAGSAQVVTISRWARQSTMRDLLDNPTGTLLTLKNRPDAPRCLVVGKVDVGPNKKPKPCTGCFAAEGTVCSLGINPSVKVIDESSEPISTIMGRPSRQSWPRGSKVG